MDSNHRSLARNSRFLLRKANCWDRTGGAKKGCFSCGTDGSNPSPSSGESAANLPPSQRGTEGSNPSLSSGESANPRSLLWRSPAGVSSDLVRGGVSVFRCRLTAFPNHGQHELRAASTFDSGIRDRTTHHLASQRGAPRLRASCDPQPARRCDRRRAAAALMSRGATRQSICRCCLDREARAIAFRPCYGSEPSLINQYTEVSPRLKCRRRVDPKQGQHAWR
jgi:hypothetical protein